MGPSWTHFPRYLTQSHWLGLERIEPIMLNRETASITAALEIMAFQTLKIFEYGFWYRGCSLQTVNPNPSIVIPLDWLLSWGQTPQAFRHTTHPGDAVTNATWDGGHAESPRQGPDRMQRTGIPPAFHRVPGAAVCLQEAPGSQSPSTDARGGGESEAGLH